MFREVVNGGECTGSSSSESRRHKMTREESAKGAELKERLSSWSPTEEPEDPCGILFLCFVGPPHKFKHKINKI